MNLQAQLDAATAARKAAESRITDEHREEQALRDRIARELEAKAAADNTLRDLLLAQREDAAREALGDGAKIGTLKIDEWPDTFVLQYDGKAFARWKHLSDKSHSDKKVDAVKNNRDYAIASTYDWNGLVLESDPDVTRRLEMYLKANPAIVTPIINYAAKLAGYFAEERKSGG